MSDIRDVASLYSSVLYDADTSTRNMTAMFEDMDGVEHQVVVRYEICSVCAGRGDYVNPSIDAHGLSNKDFMEDPDFAMEYRRGTYDIPCTACKGMGRVLVIDEEANEDELVKAVIEAEQEAWQYARERCREIEMGY